ncbi:MAG TPA: glycosyltransferase family 4 protein, partial [Candidatus Dormibacteraeota bacterium]|nr:glycosyltransferase family 4 protein [Candidatus Dormibacteraeota bacterium]
MRLLFTLPEFWPYVQRGSERVARELGVELSRRGHRVTILTRTPGARPERRRDEGVRVVHRPRRHYRRPHLRGPSEALTDLESFAVTALLGDLVRRVDAVHAFYLTDAFGVTLAERLRRRPVVLSLHGPPGRAWWEAEHPRTHRWFLRALPRIAAVTVLSEDSAARMRRDYGVDPVVLMPGIRCDELELPVRPRARRAVVCAAAVDDRRKRVDLLVAAWAAVAAEQDDVDLRFVGGGAPHLVDAARERLPERLRARVTHRAVPSRALAEEYAAATVGALTSEAEAFGLVLLESQAAGLPVVGTRQGGIPEVVGPGCGALFD